MLDFVPTLPHMFSLDQANLRQALSGGTRPVALLSYLRANNLPGSCRCFRNDGLLFRPSCEPPSPKTHSTVRSHDSPFTDNFPFDFEEHLAVGLTSFCLPFPVIFHPPEQNLCLDRECRRSF